MSQGVKAIVTDIEGTTSSISFVKDVLFPYAYEKLPEFVRKNADSDQARQALEDTADLSGQPGAPLETLIDTLLSWIEEDRKATPLKALQGLIWKQGYEQGDYRAHMYSDAYELLKTWHAKNIPIYVYSSGSVYAQQLFFSHSEYGNMLPLFSGHFDTRTGAKHDRDSYISIAAELSVEANNILFLSDIEAELDAALAAGFQTCWVIRDGTSPASASKHPIVSNFTEIRL